MFVCLCDSEMGIGVDTVVHIIRLRVRGSCVIRLGWSFFCFGWTMGLMIYVQSAVGGVVETNCLIAVQHFRPCQAY